MHTDRPTCIHVCKQYTNGRPGVYVGMLRTAFTRPHTAYQRAHGPRTYITLLMPAQEECQRAGEGVTYL